MTTQKGKQLDTIMQAEETAHIAGHLLGPWKVIDSKGRGTEMHWAICLKCGDSVFTYEDGSHSGRGDVCSGLDLMAYVERAFVKRMVFKPSLTKKCACGFQEVP